MKKVVAYMRVGTPAQLDPNHQREEILAKWGNTHEMVGEHQDIASGSQGVGERPGLKKLLEDAAQGEVGVLICNDVTRLARQMSPEILAALNKAGVRVMTADGSEIGFAEMVALSFSGKTYVEDLGERIKRGKRAARERRKAASAAQLNDGSQ